jgi:hypothetical protein
MDSDLSLIIQKVKNQTDSLRKKVGLSRPHRQASHKYQKSNNKTLSENIDNLPQLSHSSDLDALGPSLIHSAAGAVFKRTAPFPSEFREGLPPKTSYHRNDDQSEYRL